MAVKFVIAFAVLAIAQVFCAEGEATSHGPEKDLAKDLLHAAKSAGKSGRPVKNVGDAVDVKMGFSIIQLVEADKNGLVTFQSFVFLTWNDPALVWDPANYGGASQAVIPSEKIWRPDVTIWNSVLQGAAENEEDMLEAGALVMSDGTVIWVPNMLYKVPCNKNGDGELACEVIAGSWAHDASQINMEFYEGKADIDVSFVLPRDGLELTSHSAERKDKEYECCPGAKYTSMHYTFTVKQTGDGTCTKE